MKKITISVFIILSIFFSFYFFYSNCRNYSNEDELMRMVYGMSNISKVVKFLEHWTESNREVPETSYEDNLIRSAYKESTGMEYPEGVRYIKTGSCSYYLVYNIYGKTKVSYGRSDGNTGRDGWLFSQEGEPDVFLAP